MMSPLINMITQIIMRLFSVMSYKIYVLNNHLKQDCIVCIKYVKKLKVTINKIIINLTEILGFMKGATL